ncbi:hypothetical protein [Mucilaginibacter agri]|uniref:hypothetical protein n=1 Tax=Mucilaginibacter agri TaxID=2695265 RepID=UPI001AA0BCA2|nr:hypothetical protein [Mucilaginibacter agri]
MNKEHTSAALHFSFHLILLLNFGFLLDILHRNRAALLKPKSLGKNLTAMPITVSRKVILIIRASGTLLLLNSGNYFGALSQSDRKKSLIIRSNNTNQNSMLLHRKLNWQLLNQDFHIALTFQQTGSS